MNVRRWMAAAVLVASVTVGAGGVAAAGEDYVVPSPSPSEVPQPSPSPTGDVDPGDDGAVVNPPGPGSGLVASSLAQTGTNSTAIYLRAGLGFIAAGGVILLLARRRHAAPATGA